MVLVYRVYTSLQPALRSSTAVRSACRCSAPVTNAWRRSATPAGSSWLSATVAPSPSRSLATARSVRAASRVAVACARGGGLTHGSGPLGLQGGDGRCDRGAQFGVDLLGLAQPGDVLGGADSGVRPQGEQGDDGHHQQGDDLGPHRAGPQTPTARARQRLVRRGCGPTGLRRTAGRPRRPVVRRGRAARAAGAGAAAGCRRSECYGVGAWPPRSGRGSGLRGGLPLAGGVLDRHLGRG